MKTFELSKDLIDNISDLILNKNNKEIKKIVRENFIASGRACRS